MNLPRDDAKTPCLWQGWRQGGVQRQQAYTITFIVNITNGPDLWQQQGGAITHSQKGF